MRRCLHFLAFVVLTLAPTARASADATAFVGVSSPESRRTLGFAAGAGLVVLGFEFEYSHAREELESVTPSMRTFMGNLLAQTPAAIHGVQLYATIGGGFYREAFENGDSETNLATNLGGGAKIHLAGPLRLRLDYRIFALHGTPVFEKPQRFYAGLNLAF